MAIQEQEGPLAMNGQMDQRAVLLLVVGCGTVYIAFEYPLFGAALLVGVGVVTLLHVLMGR